MSTPNNRPVAPKPNAQPPGEEDLSTKLHVAAAKGDLSSVREILYKPGLTQELRHQLVEHQDAGNFNRTAVIQAARNGHLHVVEFLVREMNADLLARDSHELGSMAIHFAAELGRLEVVKFMIDFKPDLVEAKDLFGATALNLAAFAGQLKVVEYLVDEKKASIENPGAFNRTPLLSAAEQGYVPVVEFLIKRGANLLAKSNLESNEDMAIHLAAFFGHLKVVQALLEANGDLLEAKNKTEETALNRAAMGGQAQVVAFLIDAKNANKENCGEFGRTPLLQAADEGHLEVVKVLVERGADLAVRDTQNGDNALHLAAYFNHVKIAAFLLDLKADVLIQSQNKQNLTPLGLAKRQNNAEIVALFTARGFKV